MGRIIFLACLALAACSPQKSNTSPTKFSFNDNVQNAFLMIGSSQLGTANGLQGVVTDLRTIPAAMEKIPSFQKQNTSVINDLNGTVLNRSRISSELTRITGNLVADSTLMIYYSGHGMQGDGAWVLSNNETLNGDQFVSLVYQALGSKKIKRLVIASDSCFAGAFAQGASSGTGATNLPSSAPNNPLANNSGSVGSGAAVPDDGSDPLGGLTNQLASGPLDLGQLVAALLGGQLGMGLASNTTSNAALSRDQQNSAQTASSFGTAFAAKDRAGEKPYEELLFMAASNSQQTSDDLGTEGGRFSAAFGDAMTESYQKRADASATIGNFINLVKQKAATATQTPVTLLSNQAIADEKFFDAEAPAAGS